MMRRRLALLALALAAFLPVGIAHADPGCQGDNCAIAINQTDNSSVFDFAFAVKHVLGDVVDQGNGAVAYSSCNSCQTTAIAIEIVLVEGDPSTIAPQNVAVAANADCNLCDTLASAYQFVITTGGPVRFTNEGKHELHEIRKEIESWGKRGLSNDQIRALLPGVIDRLKNVLATQLVPVGTNEGRDDDESDHARTTGRPNAPPAGTATTETTGTVETTTTEPAATTEPTDTTTTTTTTPSTTATTTTAPTTTTTTTTP
jgi:putative peptide zinc metalloprotease protein